MDKLGGLAVAGIAWVAAIGVGPAALYRRLPTFETMRQGVVNSRPVQFVARQITTAQAEMIAAKEKVQSEATAAKEKVQSGARAAKQQTEAAVGKANAAVQELLRPTLDKIAGLYEVAATASTIGFAVLAVKATSLLVAVPAVGAAFVGIGVIFGIYQLHLMARKEQDPLEFFKRHISTTIYNHVAFFTALVGAASVAIGLLLLTRSRGDIIINRGL